MAKTSPNAGRLDPVKSASNGVADHGRAIVAAWQTNHRATTYLIEHFPPAVWSSPVPGVPHLTVGMIAAHLHNSRCGWIRSIGARHGVTVPQLVDLRRVTLGSISREKFTECALCDPPPTALHSADYPSARRVSWRPAHTPVKHLPRERTSPDVPPRRRHRVVSLLMRNQGAARSSSSDVSGCPIGSGGGRAGRAAAKSSPTAPGACGCRHEHLDLLSPSGHHRAAGRRQRERAVMVLCQGGGAGKADNGHYVYPGPALVPIVSWRGRRRRRAHAHHASVAPRSHRQAPG